MPRNHLGTEITHCRTGTGGLTWQEMRWRAILASILRPDGCCRVSAAGTIRPPPFPLTENPMTLHVSRFIIHLILAVTTSCVTAAGAELLYVSMPLSTNAVVTYDVSLGDATAIRNSQQTFASGTDVAAPQGMAIDQQGNVFVVNQLVNTIGKFDSSGTLLATIGSGANLNTPMGLAVDSAGTLYAANFGTGPAANSVARFDAGGNFVASMTAQINRPLGVAVDTSGHLFVGNWFLNTVSKFDSSGTFLATIGSSSTITNPAGLVTTATGELYVASEYSGVISLFDAAGTYQSSIGSGAGLLFPSGVARDQLGNLYVSSGTDSSNSLISKFDSTGAFQFSWSIPDLSGFLATAPVPVPEPSTYAMAIAGLACGGYLRFRRRKRA
jgi:streptogramin lyase